MGKDDGADTGIYSRRSCIWYHDFADEAFREISDYFTSVTIHQHITRLSGRKSLVPTLFPPSCKQYLRSIHGPECFHTLFPCHASRNS